MRKYAFSPSARDDLESIAKYIRDAAGPEMARQLLERLRSKCELLAETSGELGTLRDELADGLRSFYVQPHVLFLPTDHGRQIPSMRSNMQLAGRPSFRIAR